MAEVLGEGLLDRKWLESPALKISGVDEAAGTHGERGGVRKPLSGDKWVDRWTNGHVERIILTSYTVKILLSSMSTEILS